MAKASDKYHNYTSDKDRLRMFEYWLICENYAQVGKQFSRARSTVCSIAKKHKWVEMKKEIEKKRRAAIIRKIVKQDLDDLQLVSALQKKIYGVLLAESTNLEPKTTDAVAVTRLKLEIEGEIPPEGQKIGDTINNTIFRTNDQDEIDRMLDNAKAGNRGRCVRPAGESQP